MSDISLFSPTTNNDSCTPVVVAALYKFVELDDYHALREPLLEACIAAEVRGTLLLASEGINGTIAGSRQGVDAVLAYLRLDARFADIDCKESLDSNIPFYRMKVKIKKEIVTLGVSDINPQYRTGSYVEAEEWNALISDPDVTIIDTRNDYEAEIGAFSGAINPQTKTFRDFPKFVEENLDPSNNKKVAMYCTGGIRCEKSTAYLLQQGFTDVYHLKGGILKYLEKVPENESLWSGECFVFDNRVTVQHDLKPGSYDQCHGCRRPITEELKQAPEYVRGVCCPLCYNESSDEQKARFAERQKQIDLANERKQPHIGAPPPARQKNR